VLADGLAQGVGGWPVAGGAGGLALLEEGGYLGGERCLFSGDGVAQF